MMQFSLNETKIEELTRQHSKTNKTFEKIKQKTIQLLLVSTTHGLPNAFKTNRIIFKIMWISFFVISTFFGVNTVIDIIKTYLNYEIVTKIDVITEIPTDFPAITIINQRNKKSNKSLKEMLILCNFNLENMFFQLKIRLLLRLSAFILIYNPTNQECIKFISIDFSDINLFDGKSFCLFFLFFF